MEKRKKRKKGRDEGEIPTELLIKIGKEAAKGAINENFALGLPIHYIEDGYLIREFNDGKKIKFKKLTPIEELRKKYESKKN